MKNILLLLLVSLALMTTMRAGAQCPSDDASFCLVYESEEQGDAKAQFNLGKMYRKGEGVAQDYREAYIWFSIAKANGSENAAKALDMMNDNNQLTTAEIRSARLKAARRLEMIE